MTATRLAVGLPIAAGVTAGLFLLMRTLILVEPGEIEEDGTRLVFDINPEVEIIEPDDLTIDQIEQVDPPPPPPPIDVERSQLPDVDLTTIVGRLPEFGAATITAENVSFEVSDRDAQPFVRMDPVYPSRMADRGIEGACVMQFDVSPDGLPINVSATTCTNSGFERTSIRAVEQWRYTPKIRDGVAVARRGVVTTINYRLND